MEGRNLKNISSNYPKQLSKRELNIIYRILEQYDFKVDSCTKVRNEYRIQTSSGIVCLKRTKHGNHKLGNGKILAEEFFDKGFHNIVKYYKTRDGKSYVKYKNMLFYVIDWIDGEECNLDDLAEAVNCLKLLAEFHLISKNIDATKLKIKTNLKNLPQKFTKNLNDLEKFQRIIDRKKIKSEFDISYYNYLENSYYKGMIAVNFLKTSDYYILSNQSNKNKYLCHNNFCYDNVIKKDDKYYLTDLESIIVDLHVNDLGKLIRRLMFRKSYKWDFNKVKMLIEAYNSINKLYKKELKVMLALMIFPRKFWKLGKRRYLKRKPWNEEKYMHKLNKITKYNELQIKFLEDFLVYISEYK